MQFCNDFTLSPLPVSENTLCYFAACMGQQNLAAPTIRAYISGVRQLQIARGFPDPNVGSMPRLRQILKGVAVIRGREGTARRPISRLPVTPNILRWMKGIWLCSSKEADQDRLMLWAVSCTTFTFSRSGEMTVPAGKAFNPKVHLSVEDVSVDRRVQPRVVSIRLKRSKTDQEGRGATLIMGRSENDLCPVEALMQYLRRRGTRQGPLFQWKNGSPLTRMQFVTEVRRALSEAGLPAQNYAGHSFRIGAATTAATLGVEDSTIQTLGRWKSNAFLTYIKLGTGQLATLSVTLATANV